MKRNRRAWIRFAAGCAVLAIVSVRAETAQPGSIQSIPAAGSPASAAPAPIAPPQVVGPQIRVPVAPTPLIGVWEGSNEFKDLRVRETTQVEFRPDGVALARFVSADATQQKREPIVSAYRYQILDAANGVLTVDFEYVGSDDETTGDDRHRRVRLAIEAGRVLRSDDGAVLMRIR